MLVKLHVKLAPGWALIQVNFDPIQEIGPKVGSGRSFVSGPFFARLRYHMCQIHAPFHFSTKLSASNVVFNTICVTLMLRCVHKLSCLLADDAHNVQSLEQA